jgi:hypothetical protein
LFVEVVDHIKDFASVTSMERDKGGHLVVIEPEQDAVVLGFTPRDRRPDDPDVLSYRVSLLCRSEPCEACECYEAGNERADESAAECEHVNSVESGGRECLCAFVRMMDGKNGVIGQKKSEVGGLSEEKALAYHLYLADTPRLDGRG